MSLAQRIFFQDVFQMTAITLVSVINYCHIFSPCICKTMKAGEVGLFVARESLFVSEDRL